MRAAKLFLWLIAITIVLIVLSFTASFFLFWPIRSIEELLFTQALLVAYWILGLACAVVIEHGRSPNLMRSAMIVGAIACAGWIAIVWSPSLQSTEFWIKLAIWPTAWALGVMLIGLLLLARLPALGWLWVRRVTILFVALLGTFVCATFWFYPVYGGTYSYSEMMRYEENCQRIGFALGLLAGGGILLTIIGAWLPKVSDAKPVTPKRPFWFCCPRCSLEQDAVTGQHPCARCGLSVKVEIV